MRRAARVDGNHAQVMAAFRKMGCTVEDTSRLGSGFPDCVVSRWQKTIFVEIKDGSLPPSARKLTPDEIRFKRETKGVYCIVENLNDVQFAVKHYLM
jgi:hypothetical protein